jgi:Ca-activated chloride channel family protein
VLLLLVMPAALLLWTWRRRGRALVLPFDHARGARALACATCCGSPSACRLLLALASFDARRAAELGRAALEARADQHPVLRRRLRQHDGQVRRRRPLRRRDGGDQQFLDYRTGDAFGLTFFGNSVLHWVPLTNDVSAFRCAPPFMHPRNLPRWFGGTEIGKALLRAARCWSSARKATA